MNPIMLLELISLITGAFYATTGAVAPAVYATGMLIWCALVRKLK